MILKQEKENGVDRLRICKIGKETTITSRVRGQENTNAVEPQCSSHRAECQGSQILIGKQMCRFYFPDKFPFFLNASAV